MYNYKNLQKIQKNCQKLFPLHSKNFFKKFSPKLSKQKTQKFPKNQEAIFISLKIPKIFQKIPILSSQKFFKKIFKKLTPKFEIFAKM